MKITTVSKALILDDNGHILVLRRSHTHPTLAGHPDLPGGIIDPGEEPGQAIRREIQEETGLTIKADDLTMVYAGTESRGDHSHVRMLYIVRLSGNAPAVTISWEHDKADWLPVTELAHIETEFHSFYKDALHFIRQHNLAQ